MLEFLFMYSNCRFLALPIFRKSLFGGFGAVIRGSLRPVSIIVLLFVSVVLGRSSATAQITSGQITGRVVDKSGAVIVGAEIDIKNLATGQLNKIEGVVLNNDSMVS
jgi:hypothetical protein